MSEAFLRIRRLKCDELKPVCQRCVRDKRKCDGYEKHQAPIDLPEKQRLKFVNVYYRPSAVPAVLSRAAVPGAPTCSKQADLLHYAWKYVISSFDTSDSVERFWHTYVLALSYESEPVKQSLCALSEAHRYFSAQARNHTSLTPAINVSAIHGYNEAIEKISRLVAKNSTQNIRTTIICCVIFICIENVYGRPMDSIRHLHSACHLLHSLRGAKGGQHDPLPGVISRMLYRLGQNVAIYLGDEVVFTPDSAMPPIRLGDPQASFLSLEEANEQLEEIGSIYNEFLFAPDPDEWPNYGHFHRRCDGMKHLGQDISITRDDKRRRVLESSQAAYEVWGSRFDTYKSMETSCKDKQRRCALTSLHQYLWMTLIKRETPSTQLCKEDWQELLQRVAKVLGHGPESDDPVFTFDGDIIPALFTIWSSCHDAEMRSQVLQLMRSSHRREGIWDSLEVASLCEAWASAEERNSMDPPTPALGIPELMASSPPNGVHRFQIPQKYVRGYSGSRSPGRGLQRICHTG